MKHIALIFRKNIEYNGIIEQLKEHFSKTCCFYLFDIAEHIEPCALQNKANCTSLVKVFDLQTQAMRRCENRLYFGFWWRWNNFASYALYT